MWGEHCGWYLSTIGWKLSDHAQANLDMLKAILNVASNRLRMSNCVGAQVGYGLKTITAVAGIDISVVLTFSINCPMVMNMVECPGTSILNLEDLVGKEHLPMTCFVRLLAVDDESVETIRIRYPDIPLIGGNGPPRAPQRPRSPERPPLTESPLPGVPMTPESPYNPFPLQSPPLPPTTQLLPPQP